MVTFAVALVMIYITYEKYSLSRTFLGEAQKMSATLPVLAVTEGQVAEWTEELRKNEVFKGEMEAHLVEQINNIRLGKYTADQLNEHLVGCQRFCGQLLHKIFVANMIEVAKLPHEVVFFDLDRDQVIPRYQGPEKVCEEEQQSDVVLDGSGQLYRWQRLQQGTVRTTGSAS